MADTPSVSASTPKKTPSKKAEIEGKNKFTDAETETIKAILKQLSSTKIDFSMLAADMGGELSKESARKRWDRLMIKLNLKNTPGAASSPGPAGDNETTPVKKAPTPKKATPKTKATPKKRKVEELAKGEYDVDEALELKDEEAEMMDD